MSRGACPGKDFTNQKGIKEFISLISQGDSWCVLEEMGHFWDPRSCFVRPDKERTPISYSTGKMGVVISLDKL